MSERKTTADHKTNKKVWRCLSRHSGDVVTIAFTQCAIRLLVIGAAIGLPYLSEGAVPLPVSFGLALVMYIFLWIPMRNQGGEKLRRLFFTRNLHSTNRIPYQEWLQTGLLRYFRGLMWGVPLIALLVFVPYWFERQVMNGEDAIKHLQTIQQWSGLIGRESSLTAGLAVAAGIVLLAAGLLALLFAYGWWRDMPVEYLPSRSMGPGKTISWARHIRRYHLRELIPHALINMALCIPGVLSVGFVFYRYMIYVKINLGDFIQDMQGASALSFTAILKDEWHGLPMPTNNQLLLLAVVLLVIWLPLCVFRKMRNASLIADMMKKEHSRRRGAQKAADPAVQARSAEAKPAEAKSAGENHET